MMLANWTKGANSKQEDELVSSKEQFSFKFKKLQEPKSLAETSLITWVGETCHI